MQQTQARQVPQRRHRIHFVESEFWETNLCVSLCFASLIISLAITLCFHFDLLGCVVSVCAGTRNIFDITCRDTTPSYICARVKDERNSDIGQILHMTGLTGLHNRSDRFPILFQRLSLRPVCVLTVLLSVEFCRNLRMPIHHPPSRRHPRSFQQYIGT